MSPSADEVFEIPMSSSNFHREELKNWIPPPLEQMTEIEYDVLIVGRGAGGGAVLWRLSDTWGDNGKKIGLIEIEAGDLLLPTHPFNLPTLNYSTSRQTNGRKLYDSDWSGFAGVSWCSSKAILWWWHIDLGSSYPTNEKFRNSELADFVA